MVIEIESNRGKCFPHILVGGEVNAFLTFSWEER